MVLARFCREHFDANAVQLSTLLSIKTGGCEEDCKYCPQSAHFDTGLKAEKLIPLQEVMEAARAAKANGATRFCMGAAWRSPKPRHLEAIGEMISEVKALGLETCLTAGMLEDGQAEQLKSAGLDYYNHNLDTAPEAYGRIISTRDYQDRLDTLDHVRAAGIHVCSGGIVGMGETDDDVVDLALSLRALEVRSVPVNFLIPIPGTRMEHVRALDPRRCLRILCLYRLLLPSQEIRIAGWREVHLRSMQAMGLYPANSVFIGDYLTTQGAAARADLDMIRDIIAGMAKSPVTDQELSLAKDAIINSFIFGFAKPDAVVNQRARLEYYGYPEGYLENYRDNSAKVTWEDVLQAARTYLHPDRFTIMVVGDEKKFDQPLSTLGPVREVKLEIR